MKKNILLQFIDKHTDAIEKCRWVSNAKDKTLKVNVTADAKNLLCDITLSNWDGFADAEIGIANLPKFKKEYNIVKDEEVTFVLNYNNDKTYITSVDVMDGESVQTIATAELDILPISSTLKKQPPYNVEIILDKELKDRFLRAKAGLPDVNTFTVMMNNKNELEFIVGYSTVNSSRTLIKVKTNPGKDKMSAPLHFRADYLKYILDANSECEDTTLKISDNGLCHVAFKSGDFDCKYYLSSTD